VISYQLHSRLQRAIYLMQDQGLHLKEVASQVGYEDYYQFSKIFKDHYGVCPRSMRQAEGHTFRNKQAQLGGEMSIVRLRP